jgi:hypothetical protein
MALEGWVEHFRCSTCGHAWNLLKRRAEPVLGVGHAKPAGQIRRCG